MQAWQDGEQKRSCKWLGQRTKTMAQARVKEHEERWDSRLPEKNLLDTVME